MLYSSPVKYWVNHKAGIGKRSDPDADEQQEVKNEEAVYARALAWEQASDRAWDLLEPLFAQRNLKIREYIAARFNTILRFDDNMLVTLHLWAQPTTQAPFLHLKRRGDGGLFDPLLRPLRRPLARRQHARRSCRTPRPGAASRAASARGGPGRQRR